MLQSSVSSKEEGIPSPHSSASSLYTSESMGNQPLQQAQSRQPETIDQSGDRCQASENNEEWVNEVSCQRE